jgi:spoIIIJ-associated protein
METTPPAADPRAVLQAMLDGLGLQTKVERVTLDDGALLHIATADPSRLIGKHGQTLHQLQFLLNRILARGNPDVAPVIVDCERYRERQRDELMQQVLAAANQVRRWGEPVAIGPFGSFDRRVIHQHFEHDAELEVVSEGAESAEDGGRQKLRIRIRQQPAAAPRS